VTEVIGLRGKKLIHVVTVPQSLVFFRGQLDFMKELGLSVEIIAGPGEGIEAFAREEGVKVHVVPMARRIDPVADLEAIRMMRRIYRGVRPDIVHAHTPKGGLLGVLSARSARVPLVVYQLRGLRLATLAGARRRLFELVERTSLNTAHGVVANSHSLRREVIDLGLTSPDHIEVLGAGSGNGVDARGRFDPMQVTAARRAELRASIGVARDDVLVLYMGRLVSDKGVRELAGAWRAVARSHPRAKIVLIGGEDATDPVPAEDLAAFVPENRAIRLPWTTDACSWYGAADVVVLPTYREGMPNVLLEAAAMEKPVVATRVAGCVDCVLDGETGTLVPPRDAHALAEAIAKYLDDPELRSRHGRQARRHVLCEFDPMRLWRSQATYYARGLSTSGPEHRDGATLRRGLD